MVLDLIKTAGEILKEMFWIAIFIVLLLWLTARKSVEKCQNCGGKIKPTDLFCPWCHRDLRGGGK